MTTDKNLSDITLPELLQLRAELDSELRRRAVKIEADREAIRAATAVKRGARKPRADKGQPRKTKASVDVCMTTDASEQRA